MSNEKLNNGNICISMNVRLILNRMQDKIMHVKRGITHYTIADMYGDQNGKSYNQAVVSYYTDQLKKDFHRMDGYIKNNESARRYRNWYRNVSEDFKDLLNTPIVEEICERG